MNERFRELAEQAEEWNEDGDKCDVNLQKFAELIIQECAEVIEICSHSNCYSGHEFSFAKESIKEHFGVEE